MILKRSQERAKKRAQAPVAEPGIFGDRYLILGGLIAALCGLAVYLLSQVWPSF